jgi:hypothetical protein
VKPANVLLADVRSGRPDFCYLVDFGIARSATASTRSRLTLTGATVGTLDYMAPERFLTGPVDHRVDVYSLACVLHECLTGHRPFPGDEFAVLLNSHLNLPPPRPSERLSGLPAALDHVVVTGMAKSIEDRYSTAGDLAAAAREAVIPTQSLTPAPAPITAAPPAVAAPAAAPTLVVAVPATTIGHPNSVKPADRHAPARIPRPRTVVLSAVLQAPGALFFLYMGNRYAINLGSPVALLFVSDSVAVATFAVLMLKGRHFARVILAMHNIGWPVFSLTWSDDFDYRAWRLLGSVSLWVVVITVPMFSEASNQFFAARRQRRV